MGIYQIQILHDETEDRLLLRLSTTDNCEFRFWLTRRFVKRLWAMLVQMLEWDQAVRQQVDPATRRAVLDIQHEGYAQQANYAKKFEEVPRQLPLGETPALLAKAILEGQFGPKDTVRVDVKKGSITFSRRESKQNQDVAA